MECVLRGNQIRNLNRAINCLARIGNELIIDARPNKVTLQTLNSSRSAFVEVTFKEQFFDDYRLTVPLAQCGVLLKAVCTVFRTPPSNMERLAIILSGSDASKLQWTMDCFNGIRKTYWITCNNEPEIQHVVLDRNTFPSHLVVKPRDLNRLLANFQLSLQEITLIATEAVSGPLETASSEEGKAVELRSYNDPSKENSEGALHTQLWIDPSEEFQEYAHKGVPVDVTFSVKELKAFQGFCEGFDADMHFFFEKAGSPILLAPRFGLDDSGHADFDAMLVLATMLESQLKDREIRETRPASHDNGMPSSTVQGNLFSSVGSGEQSAHTRIWSDMSGSAATRSLHDRGGPVWGQDSADASEEIPINIQKKQVPVGDTVNKETANMAAYLQSGASGSAFRHPNSDIPAQGEGGIPCRPTEVGISMHNLSNWISEDTEEEEEDGGDDVCVQSTPPRRKGLSG